MSLVAVHTRYQFLETVRIPIAVAGTVLFPALSMLFFVVPSVGDDASAATYATGSMLTFAVLITGLFQYGVGVSEDRALPWDAYVRTLPVGAAPRLLGRLLVGLMFMLFAFVPVAVIAAVATPATASPAELALGAVALLAVSVPFTFAGLAIGYALPTKAALVTAQALFLPLAFTGGLLSAPGEAPGFVEAIAPYVPTRGAAELVWAALTGFRPSATALGMLAFWCVVFATLAVVAYKRDEGRRFR